MQHRCIYKEKGKAISVQAWGFHEVEAPRFYDSRHMKVLSLSALCTGRLKPPSKYSWYSYLLQAESTPGHSVAGRIMLMKYSMTPSGIEPTNFQLVAQCLDSLRRHLPPKFIDRSCNTSFLKLHWIVFNVKSGKHSAFLNSLCLFGVFHKIWVFGMYSLFKSSFYSQVLELQSKRYFEINILWLRYMILDQIQERLPHEWGMCV